MSYFGKKSLVTTIPRYDNLISAVVRIDLLLLMKKVASFIAALIKSSINL